MPVALATISTVLLAWVPSGITTRLVIRDDGSSSSARASEAFICLSSLYEPGWIELEFGSDVAAATNALALRTTPAAARVSPMRVAVSPGCTLTTTSPDPGPG